MRIQNRIAVLCAVCLVAFGLAACGRSSSGASGGGGGSASTGGSSSPIKLYSIAASGSPIQNYPDIAASAQAAVTAINAAGGVNGHKLEFTFCNDQADPNQSVTCARNAISDGAVALVGQLSLYDSQTLPILKSAGIPSVGVMTPGNSVDVTSSNAYPLTAGAFSDYIALPKALKSVGVTKIETAVAGVASATADADLVKQGAGTAGVTYTGSISIPLTGVSDYASYAQKLKDSGADSVVLVTTPAQTQGIIKADAAIGYKPRYGFHTVSFGESEAQTAGAAADGMILAGANPSYHETNYPAIAEYDKEMKAAGYSKPIDFRTAGINAWLSVYAVADVVKTMSGPVTAATLTAALNKTGQMNLKGITDWNPSKEGPTGYPRVSYAETYFQEIKDGQTESAGIKPFDALPLLSK